MRVDGTGSPPRFRVAATGTPRTHILVNRADGVCRVVSDSISTYSPGVKTTAIADSQDSPD